MAWASLAEFGHRPDNPRWEWEYDPDADPELKAFGDTLDEYGILQALTVVTRDAWLEHHPEHSDKLADEVCLIVIHGNRRLAIARRKEVTRLPYFCNNKLARRAAAREAGIIENYHRKSVDPIREAAELVAIREETGESKRALASRLGFSHAQFNQRERLLDLIPEFQGMVSDLVLTVQKALPIAALSHADQRALLELGPPYQATRLQEENAEPDESPGKTLSRVTIKKHSTPNDVAETLRSRLPHDVLTEVIKLLRD